MTTARLGAPGGLPRGAEVAAGVDAGGAAEEVT